MIDEPQPDRRASSRFFRQRVCLVEPEHGTLMAVWGSMVRDISTTGANVILPQELLPGSRLGLKPLGRNGEKVFTAEVVRVEPVDKGWSHGCRFLRPLTEEELQGWLS